MRQEKGHIPYPNSAPETEYYHFTINGNMQAYIYDNLIYTYYGYDGGTARKYKISYQNTPTWINGQPQPTELHIRNMMFYPNSYINFNNDGYYTKHYYNGMERIASRLGDQNLSINVNDPELQDRKDWQDSLIRKQISDISGYQFLEPGQEPDPNDPKPIYELPVIGLNNLQPSADGIFYYHPNHLGSTAYITDENQSVVQGFLYAPFGEITNEYDNSFGNNVLPKYSFNAKELDEETGMYYYEARYMAPPVFISRDRLFEKYPTFSPYTYCTNNPVNAIDPDGRDVWKVSDDGQIERSASDGGKQTQTLLFSNGNERKLKGSKYYKIMSDLSSINKDNVSSSYGTEDMQTAFAQTFKLMADNTNVEWIMERYSDNHYALGTKHDKMNSPSTYNLSKGKQQNNNVVALIHSHPMVTGFSDPTSINEQISTMGYLQKSKGIINGDAHIKRNDMRKTFYYTYFPRTKQLWVVGINRPAFIRNIDSFRDFFFGTYNSR